MKAKLFLAVLVVVVGAGCQSSPALVRALAKDPAIVSARIVTPWGTQSFTRVGGSTNIVSVGTDGSVTVNK